MTKISGVLITFNEEQHLEKCLQSLVGVVDEIVVIDSFSSDETENICKKYGVLFFQQKFLGYIEQKNFAMNKCSHDYILSLDGDEALSEELRNEIIANKENLNFDGYYFNRMNNYCGTWLKHSNWYPDKKLRLVKKNSAIWKGGNPHDYLELYPDKTKRNFKGDILHWAYNTHSEHFLKIDNFTTIAANDFIKNKNKKIGFIKILINPFWKFINNYFLKKGFLDGYHGFIICVFASMGTFLKYIKIRELQNKQNSQ